MEYKGANNHERTENLLHGPCKKRGSGKGCQNTVLSDRIYRRIGLGYQTRSDIAKALSCHGAKNTGDEDIIFVSIVAPVPSDYDPINE